MRPSLVVGLTSAAALGACTLLVPISEDVNGGAPHEQEAGFPDEAGVDASPQEGGGSADAATEEAPSLVEPCPSNDPSLVAWFRFDEDGGTFAFDCSASKLLATSIGATQPKWGAGHLGGAIDLDGTTTCLDVTPNAERFAFEGKPFTVAAWVSPRSFTTASKTGRFIVAHKANNGWHFGTDDPNKVELDFDHGDGGKVQAQAIIPSATWTHVAAIYEPSVKTTIWVNGRLTGQSTAPSPFGSAKTTPFRIGCRGVSTDNNFDGLVDDLRVYDRVLTGAEIEALAK